MQVARHDGALRQFALPFLPQRRYDEILWACDLNFVRGEDSFVRAQWAERPFVWHIYSQDEGAHLQKLDAFLARFCAGLDAGSGSALADFWHAWNREQGVAEVEILPSWANRTGGGFVRRNFRDESFSGRPTGRC
jgi:uncharacterized repeat protein (TIGR03837 family)